MAAGTAAEHVVVAKTKPVRKSATVVAVERRRDARAALKILKARAAAIGKGRQEHWRKKEQKDREASARLARRRFPPDKSGFAECPMIALDFRYWQALRCGFDMLSPGVVSRLSDPCDSHAWRWWCSLHYQIRAGLVSQRTHYVRARGT